MMFGKKHYRASHALALFLFSIIPVGWVNAGMIHSPSDAMPDGLSHAQEHLLEDAQHAYAHKPHDLNAALNLAQIKLELARQMRDPQFSEDVPEVLAHWWKQPQPPVSVLTLQGAFYQQAHDFPKARDRLHRALQRKPGDVQSLMVLSAVEVAQGYWEASRQACAALTTQQPVWLVAACLAQSADSRAKMQQSLTLIARRPGDGSVADEWAADIAQELKQRLASNQIQPLVAHPPAFANNKNRLPPNRR